MASVIEVNVKEVEQLAKKLSAYALSASDAENLLHSLGLEVAEQTKDRFDSETDPEGNKWKALSERYAEQKAKKSRGGILTRKGFMRNIVFQVNGSASVLAGSTMKYADYHQNAKKADRRRRFLGLNNNNITDLADVIDEFMGGKVNG